MSFLRKIYILCFLLLGTLYASALPQTKLDSFISVISTCKDSSTFAEWTINIHTVTGFRNFEKILLINKCIERTQELNFELLRARFLFRQSIFTTINGNYQEALSMIDEALPMFEKYNDITHLAGSYNTSGNMIASLGNTDLAVAYLQKALSFTATSKQTPKGKMRSNMNHFLVLGSIYFGANQLDSALQYYNLAYELSKTQGKVNNKGRGFAIMNLADVAYKNKEYKLCNQYLFRALSIALNQYPDIESMTYGKLGTSYGEMGKYDSALYYLNKGEKTAKENQLKRIEQSVLLRQKRFFVKTNNTTKALQALEAHDLLKNKIDSTEKSALSSFMVSQTKRRDTQEAQLKIDAEKIKQRTLQIYLISIIGLALLLSIIAYFLYQRKQLKQQLEKDRVEKEMIKSQIRAINSQMNPHFVFNALNSIQELIVTNDIRNSNIYLGKFADLMRKTLEYSQEDEIYLSQEMEALKLYLDLEQRRFGEDLIIEINNDLDEYELKEIKVPSMLFQPYVENALKHGLLHKQGEKKLTITLEKNRDQLIVSIEDNGIGRTKSAELNKRSRQNHKSYALNANQNRLDLIKYSSGRKIDVEFVDIENDGGTKVVFWFG